MSIAPKTHAAMTDGWSGDAYAVPVEFASELEVCNENLREALIKAIDLASELENRTDSEDNIIADCRAALLIYG